MRQIQGNDPFGAVSPPAVATLTGLVLGVGIELAMTWMASSGPVGDSWSFRGNGALIVPVGLGAAVLAGGLAGLCLYARGISAWAGFGVAIGTAAAVPALLSIVILVVFGSPAQVVSDLLTIPALGWPALCLAFVVAVHVRPSRARRLPAALTWLAGALFTIGMAAGFMGAEALLTIGAA